jgi:hypothetical protein
MDNFRTLAPPCQTNSTRYHMRGTTAVWNYFRDHIKHDVNKFNIALRVVRTSKPTGVDEQQIVNMAVAIHLGKTKKMDYEFKDFSASQWLFYEAWKVLKEHPKFFLSYGNASQRVAQTAASPNGPVILLEEDDDDDSENKEVSTNSIITPDVKKPAAADLRTLSRGSTKAGTAARKRKAKAEKSNELKKIRMMMERREIQTSFQTRVLGLTAMLEATGNGTDPEANEKAKQELTDVLEEVKKTTTEQQKKAVKGSSDEEE